MNITKILLKHIHLVLCLTGGALLMCIVFYDEQAVERYFDNSYTNCLPPGTGLLNPAPEYTVDDIPDMIKRIQTPPAANVHYPINALGRFGAEAESALPALEKIAETLEYRPIRKYAKRAVRQIKGGLKHKQNMSP